MVENLPMPPDLVPLLDLFTSTTWIIQNCGLDKDNLQYALDLCTVHSKAVLKQVLQPQKLSLRYPFALAKAQMFSGAFAKTIQDHEGKLSEKDTTSPINIPQTHQLPQTHSKAWPCTMPLMPHVLLLINRLGKQHMQQMQS